MLWFSAPTSLNDELLNNGVIEQSNEAVNLAYQSAFTLPYWRMNTPRYCFFGSVRTDLMCCLVKVTVTTEMGLAICFKSENAGFFVVVSVTLTFEVNIKGEKKLAVLQSHDKEKIGIVIERMADEVRVATLLRIGCSWKV